MPSVTKTSSLARATALRRYKFGQNALDELGIKRVWAEYINLTGRPLCAPDCTPEGQRKALLLSIVAAYVV